MNPGLACLEASLVGQQPYKTLIHLYFPPNHSVLRQNLTQISTQRDAAVQNTELESYFIYLHSISIDGDAMASGLNVIFFQPVQK